MDGWGCPGGLQSMGSQRVEYDLVTKHQQHIYIYIMYYIYIFHIFFIHSSVVRPLSCFHDLAVVISAAMNLGVHVSFQIKFLAFSKFMQTSGFAGSV